VAAVVAPLSLGFAAEGTEIDWPGVGAGAGPMPGEVFAVLPGIVMDWPGVGAGVFVGGLPREGGLVPLGEALPLGDPLLCAKASVALAVTKIATIRYKGAIWVLPPDGSSHRSAFNKPMRNSAAVSSPLRCGHHRRPRSVLASRFWRNGLCSIVRLSGRQHHLLVRRRLANCSQARCWIALTKSGSASIRINSFASRIPSATGGWRLRIAGRRIVRIRRALRPHSVATTRF